MDIRIQNAGTSNVLSPKVTLSSKSEFITFTKTTANYRNISANYYMSLNDSGGSPSGCSMNPNVSNAFTFTVSQTTPDDTIIPIDLLFEDSQGNRWKDGFSITVKHTNGLLRYNAYSVIDYGNGDNIPNAGEKLSMDIRIQNAGTSNVLSPKVTLSSSSNLITFTKATATYSNISANYYRSLSDSGGSPSGCNMNPNVSNAFTFTVSQSAPDDTIIPIDLLFEDSQGNRWKDGFSITVKHTNGLLRYNAYSVIDYGNGDNIPNAGEKLSMDIRIQNTGTSNVLSPKVTLSSKSEFITFTKAIGPYSNISATSYRSLVDSGSSPSSCNMNPNVSNAFTFTISRLAKRGTTIPILVTFQDSQGNTWTDGFEIAVQ